MEYPRKAEGGAAFRKSVGAGALELRSESTSEASRGEAILGRPWDAAVESQALMSKGAPTGAGAIVHHQHRSSGHSQEAQGGHF
mmetsp:Transcript_12182/g.35671  ORF Transcript_12182/g.35671 Transcript_12182/m.35671 type:complete len:84 (-) Transcript_12182:1631-1882(-)